jgi:DegV family protein with EDD domain
MIKIITDTTSELPEDIRQRYQIPVVPQLIHFGEETYLEGQTIGRDQFMARLTSSADLPKTAAPPPELFAKIFAEHADQGHQFLCIHPSALLSGTVRSATVAAQDFPQEDIRVLDTRLIASPLGVLVRLAAEMAHSGCTAEAILSRLQDLSGRSRFYFVVSTLDYLARGGRIGGASALIGNALQLKPILTLEDGQVETCSKERTLTRAVRKVQKLVVQQYPSDRDGYLTIMHAQAPELAESISRDLQHSLDIPPPLLSDLTPAIVTHAGPGAVAVGFFT